MSVGGASRGNERTLPLSAAADIIPEVEAFAGSSRGAVVSEEAGNSFFATGVRVERDSLLMLKATYHPNWRATVDGVKTETVMLMPSFLGVPLPPGDHQVKIQYRPRRLRIILLWLGLISLPLIAIVENRGSALSSRFSRRVLVPSVRLVKRRHR